MSIDPSSNEDPEIAAIAAVGAALSKLDDEEARRRVIDYIVDRFAPKVAPADGAAVAEAPTSCLMPTYRAPNVSGALAAPRSSVAGMGLVPREIPGIARITDTGEMKITVRDLKAKNARDAVVRLSHITIWAHEKLTGLPLSSRKGLTPILKEWRIYSGNARSWLANNKGFIRSGDSLMLDAHARRDAEAYAADVVNDDVTGTWRPR
jgi:hypothetical protein